MLHFYIMKKIHFRLQERALVFCLLCDNLRSSLNSPATNAQTWPIARRVNGWKRIIDLNCKNNNSQRNSQWWNRFAYRKKIMKAIPLDHLSWQIEIRATTWRMCYVAYTNRAVAVYNYTPAEKGGDWAGHAADWLNAKSLNPIQSHWQQLGSIRRFFSPCASFAAIEADKWSIGSLMAATLSALAAANLRWKPKAKKGSKRKANRSERVRLRNMLNSKMPWQQLPRFVCYINFNFLPACLPACLAAGQSESHSQSK